MSLETDPTTEPASSGLVEVLRQTWPASLTMLGRTLTQFVDGLMVAHTGAATGPLALTAQSVAGTMSFVPEAFAIGVLAVVNTYVSQNLGAGRLRRCGQYACAGILIAVVTAALMAPLLFLAGPLFGLFKSHGARTIALESLYFRYMVIGAFATLPVAALNNFFFGIHRPKLVLATSAIANLINVVANYVLIYGKLGFPAMGLEGAAIGSVFSWVVQLVILLALYLGPAVHSRYGTRWFQLVRWRHIADILKIGWPSGVRFCNAVLSWSVFTAALVGAFGPAHLAASAIAVRYMSLSFMPAVGIGIAATAIVGKLIGQGRADLARRNARLSLLTAMVYMGACGLAFWIFRGPMIRLFLALPTGSEAATAQARALTAKISDVGGRLLLCAAVFQLFDAVIIVYVGALRGAGDTRWPMVVTIILSWGITVAGGYAMVRFMPELGSVGPWIAASAYVIVLGFVVGWRFESGAWEKINLLHATPEAIPGAEASPVVPEMIIPEPTEPAENAQPPHDESTDD